MKEIKLTRGQVALVDDADYEELSRHKWQALKTKWNSFYAVRNSKKINGKYRKILMAREILGLEYGDRRQGDHVNHITLDNCRSNLRVCTNRQNNMNRKIDRTSSSQFKGVSWHKAVNKWHARIKIRGKTKYLGLFIVEEDAAKAYDEAAKQCFGEFAYLNFN